MGNKAAELKPQHYKALELLGEGSLSIKEVADACGIDHGVMYALYEGDIAKVGTVAALFRAELEKQSIKNSEQTRVLRKDSSKKALYMINERLTHLKTGGKLGEKEVREVTRIMNALSKSTPTVEFNQNVSIYKGYSPEEIVHEFKRLSAIAKHTLDGRGVPSSGKGRAGEIPQAPRHGDSMEEV